MVANGPRKRFEDGEATERASPVADGARPVVGRDSTGDGAHGNGLDHLRTQASRESVNYEGARAERQQSRGGYFKKQNGSGDPTLTVYFVVFQEFSFSVCCFVPVGEILSQTWSEV